MRYVICMLLLVAGTSYASVDCNSPDYAYNPTVKKTCEDMQKTISDTKKRGNERFAQLYAEKHAAAQKASKAAAPQAQETTQPAQTPYQNQNQSPSNNARSYSNNGATGVITGPTTQMPSIPAVKNPAPVKQQAQSSNPSAANPANTSVIPPSYTAPATIPVPSAADSAGNSDQSTNAPGPSHSIKYY